MIGSFLYRDTPTFSKCNWIEGLLEKCLLQAKILHTFFVLCKYVWAGINKVGRGDADLLVLEILMSVLDWLSLAISYITVHYSGALGAVLSNLSFLLAVPQWVIVQRTVACTASIPFMPQQYNSFLITNCSLCSFFHRLLPISSSPIDCSPWPPPLSKTAPYAPLSPIDCWSWHYFLT